MRAGIALGSNLGERLRHLQKARDRILQLDAFGPPLLQSAIYETEPVDCETGAADFYNAVIEIEFGGSPEELLAELQEIERLLGRPPDHPRNAPRTVDLDVLYFGPEQRNTGELHLPHARMREREFVLRPLAEIAPSLHLPGEKASVLELLTKLQPGGAMRCVTKHW